MRYLNDLLFWVKERESIRVRKDVLKDPPPWTSDPVLAEYRFCNVKREDDKVTKWIHQNWLIPYDGAASLPFAMCVARMINLPETLHDLGYPHEWSAFHFVNKLGARKAIGLKVWTAAYMITGGYSKGGESKEIIIARVLDQAYENLSSQHGRLIEGESLASAAQKIKCPGIGSFLSAQVIADLKFSSWLRAAPDWRTWCAPGPGSTMGLNFLHGRDPYDFVNDSNFIREVNEVREILADEGTYLCAQNTQNCLCEFSKYVRAKHFNKKLKSKYRP